MVPSIGNVTYTLSAYLIFPPTARVASKNKRAEYIVIPQNTLPRLGRVINDLKTWIYTIVKAPVEKKILNTISPKFQATRTIAQSGHNDAIERCCLQSYIAPAVAEGTHDY